MKFKSFNIEDFKKSHTVGPYVSISMEGGMRLSSTLMSKLHKQGVQNYAHFDITEGEKENFMYISIDTKPKNGLKIRIDKKETGSYPTGVLQCSGFVRHLIELFDLALAEDKKKSVRFEVDIDNPVKHDDKLLYKLF